MGVSWVFGSPDPRGPFGPEQGHNKDADSKNDDIKHSDGNRNHKEYVYIYICSLHIYRCYIYICVLYIYICIYVLYIYMLYIYTYVIYIYIHMLYIYMLYIHKWIPIPNPLGPSNLNLIMSGPNPTVRVLQIQTWWDSGQTGWIKGHTLMKPSLAMGNVLNNYITIT